MAQTRALPTLPALHLNLVHQLCLINLVQIQNKWSTFTVTPSSKMSFLGNLFESDIVKELRLSECTSVESVHWKNVLKVGT